MQLIKDTSSKTLVPADASTVPLQSALSNGINTNYRAAKGIRGISPTARSKHVKAKIKHTVFEAEARLPPAGLKISSPKLPLSKKVENGAISSRRIDTTDQSSSQGNSATVVIPPTPQLSPVLLPTNNQSLVATGIPESVPYWPVGTTFQVEVRQEYVSAFLHGFVGRVFPTHLGLSLSEHSVHAWMYWVLATVSNPRSEQAKGLLRANPGGVLFAAQLQLVNACSQEIEEMAQRAASRDYYYDFLIRACGHARAKEWLSGRWGEDGKGRKKMAKGSGRLISLRKRVLVGQGFKAYNEMMMRQLDDVVEDSVSKEV